MSPVPRAPTGDAWVRGDTYAIVAERLPRRHEIVRVHFLEIDAAAERVRSALRAGREPSVSTS